MDKSPIDRGLAKTILNVVLTPHSNPSSLAPFHLLLSVLLSLFPIEPELFTVPSFNTHKDVYSPEWEMSRHPSLQLFFFFFPQTFKGRKSLQA